MKNLAVVMALAIIVVKFAMPTLGLTLTWPQAIITVILASTYAGLHAAVADGGGNGNGVILVNLRNKEGDK